MAGARRRSGGSTRDAHAGLLFSSPRARQTGDIEWVGRVDDDDDEEDSSE